MKIKKRFETKPFAGLQIAATTPSAAVGTLLDAAHSDTGERPLGVHLVNAYCVALAHEDSSYGEVLRGADVILPDGRPLSWFQGRASPKLRQVRGPKFFVDVMDAGRHRGTRHYLLGSTPETLALLEERLQERFSGLSIVGSFSPPFRAMSSQEYDAQDAEIRRLSPDIVWVGLGTPKQDFEVARLKAARVAPLVVAVGAAFDFASGTKKEASPIFGFFGLEWLHRFISEPRRLWRRYLFGNAKFLGIAIRAWFFK